MKKKLDFLVTSFYILILMILSIFIFWETYAKAHVEKYIKVNYGDAIISTQEDCKLLKSYDLPLKDDTKTNIESGN